MKAARILSPRMNFPLCLKAYILRARFTPISRFAAVVLSRLALLMLMAAGLAAVAAQAQTAHFYMSESVLPTPTSLYYPAQLAVDTKGNIYIADQDNYRVVKETPAEGGFIETVISTGTGLPYGVAVDQSGNVYIACNNQPDVIKETLTPTGYTQSTFGSNLFASTSLAVDSNGVVYVATYTALMVETPSGGSYIQSQIPLTNTKQPFGVAVDSNFNVYITGMDFNYLGHVWKLTPSIVGYSQVSLSTNPSGFGELAVDGAGNIYIANGSYSDILVFTPSGGGYYNASSLPQEQFYFGVLYTHSVAVDKSGNVFFTDYFNQLLVEYSPSGGNAGPLPANGGYPSQYPISEFFAIDSGSTQGTEGVISGGSNAPSLDFVDAGTGSCEGGFWSTGDVCSVDVDFQPTAVGDRYGAAVLYDGSGNTIATGYARGIGQGPLVNFSPGTAINENILSHGSAVAVDASGNLYTVAPNRSAAFKDTPAGGPSNWNEVTIGNLLGSATGIAIDGAGNLYIADQGHQAVVKETLTSNGYVQSVIANQSNGLIQPNGVAVDPSGNVYVADVGTNLVYKEIPSGSSYFQTGVPTSPLSQPNGVAVDSVGSVYITDTNNGRVLKETLAGQAYIESTIAAGLSAPTAVAVDAFGNVYISETAAGVVLKETLTAGSYVQSTIASGITPYGLALDSNLNLYVAGSTSQLLIKLDVADAPSLTFASTPVGSVSADSPQTVTLANNGNAVLTFPIPSSGNNPSISTNFTLDSGGGTACPTIESTSPSPGNLSAGTSCTLSISFSPESTGNSSGALVVTDNSLNIPNAAQSISLSGNGAAPAVGTTTGLGSSPNPSSYGQTVTITATVAQVSGTTVPTGTVQFSIDGNGAGSPVTLNGGVATYNANSLTAGMHSISAVYTPAVGSAFATSSAAPLSQVVHQVTSTITWATPGAITYGTPLSATQLDASPSVAGNFSYTPALGAVLAAGSQTLSVTFTPTDATDYTAATQTVQLTVNKAPLSVTANNQSMIYGGAVPTLTGTITGVVGSDGITASYTTTGTSSSPVGPYPITATLNDPNSKLSNYAVSNTPGTLTISKVTSTITWATPGAITYGTTLSAAQLDASSTVAGSFNYTPALGTILTAGSQTLSVTFTPTDAIDYTAATQTVQLTVNKATLSVTVNNQSMSYGGTVPTLTGTLTGVIGSDSITASYATTGTSSSTVGSYPITATLNDPNSKLGNYAVTNTPGTLTINKATPAITWALPGAITYGTPLSATQLDASSTVAGSFNYTPALGTVLTAGSQTLSVTFTPMDTTDYAATTQTVQLTINKATPAITWATPAAIFNGTALSAAQLDATASVPGAFAYTPAAGTIPTAGTNTLSVNFTPADATDYSVATATVTLTVNNPAPVVTGLSPLFVSMGSPAFTLTVTGSGFGPNSTVHWGTTSLATQYVNAGQLTVQVPASDVAAAGMVGISVVTPAPGGGTSNNLQFEIDSATPGSTTPPIFSTLSDTVTPGSTATYPVTLPSSATDISATCLNLPSGASCSFSQATGVLTITTSATTPAGTFPITVVFTETLPAAGAGLVLLPFFLLPLARVRKGRAVGRINQMICLGIVLIGVAASVGCAGGSQTQKGSQTQTVTSSGTVSLTVQ